MRIITHDRLFIFDPKINVTPGYRIKKIIAPLFDGICNLLIRMNRPRKTAQKRYNLVVCAIFKDEAPWMQEWIEHHRIVGIEHFFLYNNFSTDNYKEVLAPYIEQGLVTLIDFPVENGQFPSYEHFWANYRSQTQWVTYIDLDEFYCPYYDLTISDWLQKYKHQPSVLIYWKMFGTSGKLDHNQSQLVTEQYTICWDKLDSVGKVIINTDWNFSRMYHHRIKSKCKFLGLTILVPSVNEFGHYAKWPINRKIASKKETTIQLNHYWSKSYDSYRIGKIERGDVNNHLRDYHLFFAHEQHNRSADYTIFRFLVKLKLAMQQKKE